jgi:hypothetical protein
MTRIRPDKQIMRAPAAGYILRSDSAGELQFALLSAIMGSGGGGSVTGIVSIDKLFLEGNNLVLLYTDATGIQQRKTVDLSIFAVDINLSGAILQNPSAGTYILALTETDGSTVNVNLSDLLAVATQNSADINLTGNGTAATPLIATLKPSLRYSLGDYYVTDEFLHLTSGNSVTLTRIPNLNLPIHVYRNGLRITHTEEWFNAADPKVITLVGVAAFGDNGMEAETVIVDYFYLPDILPTTPID